MFCRCFSLDLFVFTTRLRVLPEIVSEDQLTTHFLVILDMHLDEYSMIVGLSKKHYAVRSLMPEFITSLTKSVGSGPHRVVVGEYHDDIKRGLPRQVWNSSASNVKNIQNILS